MGDLASLTVVEDRPSAAEILTYDEKLVLLGQAIVALPARSREIILLHKVQGLSQAEAAEILGLTVKAVEGAVYRAKKQLSETLKLDRPQVATRSSFQSAPEKLFRRIDSITW